MGFVIATKQGACDDVLKALEAAKLVDALIHRPDEQEVLKDEHVLLLSWPHIVQAQVIEAQKAVLNVHNSLLPRYRGRHAFAWALINGERFVGFTLHEVTCEIDAGPIYSQLPMEVSATDDINTLSARGWATLKLWLPGQLNRVLEGSLRPTPQDESRATYYPRRNPEDGRIVWSHSAESIRNLARALRPPYTPGAFFEWEGNRYHVDRAEAEYRGWTQPPGSVLEVDREGSVVLIGCGDGQVRCHLVSAALPLARGTMLVAYPPNEGLP